MTMLNILQSHASVRDYTSEKITDEKFYKMIEAAQHASSSNFVQAYTVIQVKDAAKKEMLGQLSNNERQYSTAALSLLFCADLYRAKQGAAKAGQEMEGGTLENFVVSVIDTALFAQNFVVAAESNGYGICYIGGVRNKPKEISELFGLPDHVVPLFGMTVGVPAHENEVKPRMPLSAIIHEDGYHVEKYEQDIPDYDEVMAAYYEERKTNQKSMTWSSSMAAFLGNKRREHLLDFYQSKGFLSDEVEQKEEAATCYGKK